MRALTDNWLRLGRVSVLDDTTYVVACSWPCIRAFLDRLDREGVPTT